MMLPSCTLLLPTVWCLPGHKDVSMVVDPGPGLLLVTGGSGRGILKAGVVIRDHHRLVDEVELQPGTCEQQAIDLAYGL